MDIQQIEHILNNVYLVDIKLGFPSGTIAGSQDLLATSNKDVVRVGVQVWDPKHRRPFGAARQKVRRLCSSLGTSLMGGYAIPVATFEDFKKEVMNIRDSFFKARDEFLKNLPTLVQEWADRHQQLSEVILAGCPSVNEATRAFRFDIQVCKVVPPEAGASGDLKDNHLYTEVTGMAAQIAREIAQDVVESWGGSAGGRTTAKVVGLIRRCHKKARALAFVHPKVAALADLIEEVLNEVPGTGPIEGPAYFKVVGLLRMLSDPDNILGEQVIEVDELVEVDEGEADPTHVDVDQGDADTDQEDFDAPTQTPALRVGWMF